ncbi:helix-turn-helix domain-containing protein [Nocardia aobensis]|uniref:Helix-turn-helix domain-containing protein n=1 Tax=Nocardia aobensis TaxID=257277 RepID=A0ABW6PEH1_9NOCA|nr:helix-turn-helix domain-containing protein [Nocardia elegans]MBF6451086.1 helix-turn-helix transcriptional regulator [Nocardia elegans]
MNSPPTTRRVVTRSSRVSNILDCQAGSEPGRPETIPHSIAPHRARNLFVAEGYTSATVDHICDLVGVSPLTFHRHFTVKDEDVLQPLFARVNASSCRFCHSFRLRPVDLLAYAFIARAVRASGIDERARELARRPS